MSSLANQPLNNNMSSLANQPEVAKDFRVALTKPLDNAFCVLLGRQVKLPYSLFVRISFVIWSLKENYKKVQKLNSEGKVGAGSDVTVLSESADTDRRGLQFERYLKNNNVHYGFVLHDGNLRSVENGAPILPKESREALFSFYSAVEEVLRRADAELKPNMMKLDVKNLYIKKCFEHFFMAFEELEILSKRLAYWISHDKAIGLLTEINRLFLQKFPEPAGRNDADTRTDLLLAYVKSHEFLNIPDKPKMTTPPFEIQPTGKEHIKHENTGVADADALSVAIHVYQVDCGGKENFDKARIFNMDRVFLKKFMRALYSRQFYMNKQGVENIVQHPALAGHNRDTIKLELFSGDDADFLCHMLGYKKQVAPAPVAPAPVAPKQSLPNDAIQFVSRFMKENNFYVADMESLKTFPKDKKLAFLNGLVSDGFHRNPTAIANYRKRKYSKKTDKEISDTISENLSNGHVGTLISAMDLLTPDTKDTPSGIGQRQG